MSSSEGRLSTSKKLTSGLLPVLSPAGELIETDGRDRPEQATPATTGKKKGISGRLVVITTAAIPIRV